MTKIEIEIPYWAEDLTIRVFAGVHFLMYKDSETDTWYQKDQFCSMCGRCCSNFKEENSIFQTEQGKCIYLEKNRMSKTKKCFLGIGRPFSCLISEPSKKNIPECTIIWKKVK